MGKGSSGLGGGDGFEKKGAKSVAGIDLSDSPLRYGGGDLTLSGKRRAAVEAFESRYADAKIENGATFDADGNITEKRRGGKGSVKTSYFAMSTADTFSHNHPRGDGVIGGTFSEADLSNFSNFSVKTFRATAKEGTYSISKGSNFDKAGFRSYYNTEFAKIKKASNAVFKDINSRYNTIPYSQYQSEHRAASNKMLVDLHNVLINGQKQYGYTYTLERRK